MNFPQTENKTPATSAASKILEEIKRLKEENALLKQGDSIAVIGMACRLPSANNINQFWDILEKGKNAVREIPENRTDLLEHFEQFPEKKIRGGFLEDISAFDAPFFNISAIEAESMDPQHRLFLEVAYHALEEAGINVKNLSGSQTGVFVGTTNGEYFFKNVKQEGEEMLNSYSAIGGTLSAAACRLSYYLGLEGPSMIVDTACSSSLVALDMACKNLRDQSCYTAIAGGVNSMVSPVFFETLLKLNALSPDGVCKTFDDGANGYVRGEGCGVVILKRYSDAVKDGDRILGVIKGIAVNQDGKSNGFTAPNEKAQEKVINAALTKAGVSYKDISYLEAHGTGTKLGDPIELNALCEAYKRKETGSSGLPLYIGSVKTNIGHLESAAGIAGFIKVLLSLQHKKIPAHLNFNTPNKFIPWDILHVKIPQSTVEWVSDKKRLAALSSFGFTGTNVHVIIEEGVASYESLNEPSREILTVSAKSKEALADLIISYKDYLSLHKVSLKDFCYTINAGRAHYKERIALVVSSLEDAIHKLSEIEQGKKLSSLGSDQNASLIKIIEDYEKGEEIDWMKYYEGKKFHKIEAPLYPFQHKSYWLGKKQQPNSVDNDSYAIEWREQELVLGNQDLLTSAAYSGDWLIFSEENQFNNNLTNTIRAYNKKVISVKKGKQYEQVSENEFYVDPKNVSHFNKLFSQLSDRPIIKMVYLWNSISSHVSLLNLLKASPASQWKNVKLWLLTNAAYEVGPAIEFDSLIQSLIWGMGKSVFLEYPDFFGGMIDISNEINEKAIVKEIEFGGIEDHIVLKDNKRYVARLKEITYKKVKPFSIDKNGYYLVTGGLGYLGLYTAEWLIGQGAKKLILTTRQDFPEHKQWNLIDKQDKNYEKIQRFIKMKQQAVEIQICKLDITSAEDIASLFEKYHLQNSLKGVVHAAGQSIYKTIDEMVVEDFDVMIDSKVIGPWNLHEFTKDLNLDLFVMFSSVSSVWGSKGLAHYAAANHFMDNLANQRYKAGLPALTLNIGMIEGRGLMQFEHQLALKQSGFEDLSIKQLFEKLQSLLTTDLPQVTLAKMNWGNFKKLYEYRRKRPLFDEIIIKKDTIHYTSKIDSVFRKQVEELPVNMRKTFVVSFIQSEVAQLLNIEEAGQVVINKGFFQIGLDSLMAVELKNRVEKKLGVLIPATLIFDYPTIEDVSNYLLKDILQLEFEVAVTDDLKSLNEKELDEMSEEDLAILLEQELNG